jgi:hypothetical protein
MARITSTIIYQEIIALREQLEKHSSQDDKNFQELRRIFEGSNGNPGMKIDVDRLKEQEKSRQRHFGYLWGAVLVLFGALVKLALS